MQAEITTCVNALPWSRAVALLGFFAMLAYVMHLYFGAIKEESNHD